MYPPQRNPYEQYLDIPTQRMRTNFSDFQLSPQVTGPGELSGVNMGDYGNPPQSPMPFGQDFGQDYGAPPPMPAQTPPPPMPEIGGAPDDLFGGLPTPSLGQPSAEKPFDVGAEMAKYQPEHTASDRYNQLIGQYPQHERPSALRTIAATLSAFGPGGHQTGQRVMDDPFNEKMTDWKNQIGPAQQAASLERYNNVNERTLRYQTVTAQLKESADRARAENNEKKAQIAEHRASIYDYKAHNPTKKLMIQKGGNIFAFDADGTPHDTGVASGTLTEMDKINLGIEGRKEVVDIQHQGKMEEIGQKDTNLTKQKGIAQEKKFAPRGAGTSGESGYMKPSQQDTMARVNADRLRITKPELGKWIHWNGSHIEVDPPDPDETPDDQRSFWQGARTGPTKKEYDQISSAIFGPMQGSVMADRNRAALSPATGDDDYLKKANATLPPNSGHEYILNPNWRPGNGQPRAIPRRK